MRTSSRWIVLAVLALIAAPLAAAEAPRAVSAKDQKIRQLLALTGAASLGKQTMQQMLPSLKKLVPQAPASFWDEFMAEVDVDGLADRIVPIYGNHFSESEIDAMIAFYGTPVGKKAIQEMPAILTESMNVGRTWGAEIAQRVLERARAKGLQPQT